jgi:hypothetical protein
MSFKKVTPAADEAQPVTARHLFGKVGRGPLIPEPTTPCKTCKMTGLAQRDGVCCDCRETAGEKWCDVCEAPVAEGFSVGASLVCRKHADALAGPLDDPPWVRSLRAAKRLGPFEVLSYDGNIDEGYVVRLRARYMSIAAVYLSLSRLLMLPEDSFEVLDSDSSPDSGPMTIWSVYVMPARGAA